MLCVVMSRCLGGMAERGPAGSVAACSPDFSLKMWVSRVGGHGVGVHVNALPKVENYSATCMVQHGPYLCSSWLRHFVLYHLEVQQWAKMSLSCPIFCALWVPYPA